MNRNDLLEEFFTSRHLEIPQISIRLGLDRVRLVAQKMGLLKKGLLTEDSKAPSNDKALSSPKLLIVGGTNGKGSTLKMAEQYLVQAGFSVGCYTSPHLIHYRERVRIQGHSVSDTLLQASFDAVLLHMDISDPLSYFEFGTLSALWCFREAKLDYWLLEVGLGGRLDAVNILSADVSVITSIDFDHMAFLGDTREKIGFEKAGIFRPDQWAICGATPVPESITLHAKDLGVRWVERDQFVYTLESEHTWCWQGFQGLPIPKIQIQNAVMGLLAVRYLGVELNQALIIGTLQSLSLAGRVQWVSYAGRSLLFDVAHNPEAARYLASYLEKNLQARFRCRKIAVVFALMQDKDLAAVLAPFQGLVDQWFLPKCDHPRAMAPEKVLGFLQHNKLQQHELQHKDILTKAEFTSATIYSLPFDALQAALTLDSDYLIVCFGSFYLVGPLLSYCAIDV